MTVAILARTLRLIAVLGILPWLVVITCAVLVWNVVT